MTDCNLYLEALQKVFNEEFEKDMADLEQMEEAVLSDKFEKKMAKLIKRQKKPYFKLICTTGRRAACIIAAIIILSASALSVEAVRKAIFGFIVSIFSDHNVVSVVGGTAEGYPETIEEEYYISKLGDEYKLEEYSRISYRMYSYYSNNNSFIIFIQTVKSKYISNVDNEHLSVYDTIQYDGQTYLTYKSDGYIGYIWDNGKYVFELYGNLNKSATLDLCSSTKIKESAYK